MTDDDVERLDNPNQQVVRSDGSGPADEGSGGTTTPVRSGSRRSSRRSEPTPEAEPVVVEVDEG